MSLKPGLVAILAAGCAGPPTDALTWREGWELLALTEDGGVLDARVVVGNTGLLRGQGRMALDRWTDGEAPILFSRTGAPLEVAVAEDRGGATVSTDWLGGSAIGWTARVSSDVASASLQVAPGGPTPKAAAWMAGDGQWTLTADITDGALVGWVEAGARGGMLAGRAVALHWGGDGWPTLPREALFAIGRDVTVGYDRHGGGALAWARVGGRDLDVSTAQLRAEPDGPVVLDLRPAADLVVTMRRRKPAGRTDPLDHLLGPERWLARGLAGAGARRIQRGTAKLVLEGVPFESPALYLEEGP